MKRLGRENEVLLGLVLFVRLLNRTSIEQVGHDLLKRPVRVDRLIHVPFGHSQFYVGAVGVGS